MEQLLTGKELKHELDKLIVTARDTQIGYEAAADHVKNPELESLFREYARQRQNFTAELQAIEPPVGEAPADKPSMGGKLQAGWIGFREAINWENETVVLAEVGKMEKSAISDYESALKKNLPVTARPVLERQLTLMREGHARAEAIYANPNKSDRGPIPGTHTDGTGSTPPGRAPVPRS